MGHFVPEQLPSLLVLHALLPSDIPILAIDAPIVRRYLQPLMEMGIVHDKRIIFHNAQRTGPITIRADSVYMPLNSHFSNVMSGDTAMRIARDTYAPVGRGIYPNRHVLLIDRGVSSRRLINADAVRSAITQALKIAPGLDPSARALPIVNWKPTNNASHDIAAFRQAALIVAPHGAGLSNMLFATEGTPIIEICYDSNAGRAREMLCPAMYGAMAVNLNLPYWVITAHGTYTSGLRTDLAQLRAALDQALALVARKAPRAPPQCS